MSTACNRISLQQDMTANSPAEAQLNGDETLEVFVEMVRLREKSKGNLLPALSPAEPEKPKKRPIAIRMKQALFCT